MTNQNIPSAPEGLKNLDLSRGKGRSLPELGALSVAIVAMVIFFSFTSEFFYARTIC